MKNRGVRGVFAKVEEEDYTDSGDSSDSTSPGTRSAAFIEREIPLYRAENEVKRSGDPLLWWKRNEHRFQTLAKLA